MTSFSIEQEVKEELNKYIVESLTVSDEVLSASKKVEEYILKHIQSQEAVSFADGGGKRNLSFTLPLFDDKLNVIFSVNNYNFINSTYYKNFTKNKGIDLSSGSSYNKIGKKIVAICFLNYLSLNFIPSAKFYEDLHHELNHLLQQNKSGHTYNDSDSYTNISSDIYETDELKHNVAELLYLCIPSEQDSFVSSVYSFVKKKYHIDWNYNIIDDCIKDTEAYKSICNIKSIFKVIVNNKPKYEWLILKKNNFSTWDKFEKYVEKSLRRFEKKFAMCVKKCKNDFVVFDSNTWTEATVRKMIYPLL